MADQLEMLLPSIPEDAIPTFSRHDADAWERLSQDSRSAAVHEFRNAYEAGGVEAAKKVPWWPILANLTIAPLFGED